MLESMPCDHHRELDGEKSGKAELASAVASARAAGLRYVTDERPGIRRKRCGKGWCFYGPDGSRITDEETLRRIRSLAIPPAYTNVWICPDPRGHMQATGRDAKGRKQYRYHARWREVRDAVKYDRMLAFADALPKIRAQVDKDLSRPGLSREKVLATVVCLLEHTKIRVGNEEYARKNHSYGLTTMHTEHVSVEGTRLRFTFRGKSGKDHAVSIRDRRLSRVVQRCLEIPGQELFTWVDAEGHAHAIDSGEVNDYLRSVVGGDGGAAEGEFTAKDFRTWHGTVMAAKELRGAPPCASQRASKQAVVKAITAVSTRLGNTPTVCKKSYVHPAVLDAFHRGTLTSFTGIANEPIALDEDERFTLALLRSMASAAERAPTLAQSLQASIASKPRVRSAKELRRAA